MLIIVYWTVKVNNATKKEKRKEKRKRKETILKFENY